MLNAPSIAFMALVMMFMTAVNTASQTRRPADRTFIENKGQIGDQDGNPNRDVRFLIVRQGLNIQLRTNGFSYDSYVVDRCELPSADDERSLPPSRREHSNQELTYRFHRVDIELVDASPMPVITSHKPSADYLNYYTHITEQANGEQGATSVRGFDRVTYHDVWPYIDLEWFIDEDGNPEYQFMVRPGGDPDRIRLRYHGANATELLGDAIMIHVDHGPIRERIPKSFYVVSGQPVDVRYRKVGHNTFGVMVPSADMATAETLVIDPAPERLWGTYYGGTGVERCSVVAVTSAGDIVQAGQTNSTANIATAGSHQQVYGGNFDGYMAVLTSAGTRRWATYYGGADPDAPNSVAVMSTGDIALSGYAESAAGISTAGSHQPVYSATGDAFLAVFTGDGVRRWATYYGGTGWDYGNAVAETSTGDIVLAGKTASANGIATVGSHQEVRSGAGDAYVAVFTDAGVRRWGTYYGGTGGGDGAFGVAVTPKGDIVLSGETNSAGGIATAGAHQQALDGLWDAFLAVFTDAGVRRWGTYYGGEGNDWDSFVAVTSTGDIVLAGTAGSNAGIATAGAHQQTSNGDYEAYVAVFTDAGVRRWGTYYGGTGWENGLAVAVTPTDDIVLAGYTPSTTAIATTGSHQETNGGGANDAFVAVLTDAGVRIWGSYYGGTGDDRGMGVAVTPAGDIVLAGYAASTNAVATAGVHQQTFGGGASDAFVAVFDVPCTPPSVTLTSSVVANKICLEQVTTLTASAGAGTRLRWTQPKRGTITSPLTDTTVSIRWTSVGVDTVRVRVMRTADSTCLRDTMLIVTVNALPTPVISSATGFAMCDGDSLTLDAGAAFASYAWLEGTTPVGTGRYLVTKKAAAYAVLVSNGTCSDTSAFVSTIVNRLPTPVITSATGFAMCDGDSVRLDGGAGYVSYAWFEGATQVGTGRYLQTKKSAKYTVRVSNDTCFGTSPVVSTIVNRLPTPVIASATGFAMCAGDSVRLDGGAGYVSYAWFEGNTPVGTGRYLVTNKAASYTVRVSNDTCFGTSPAVVTIVNPLPTPVIASATGLAMCEGDSLRLDAGAGYASYAWFEGTTPVGTGRYLVTRKAATYTVRVSNDFACSGTSPAVTVTINPLPTPVITSSTGLAMCAGDSVRLDAGAGYATYAWSEGTTPVGTGRYHVTRKAATYTVRVSNDNACSGTSASIQTTVNPLPDVAVNGPTAICLSDATGKAYTVPQGDQGTRYNWTITPPSRGSIITGRTGAQTTITWQQPGSATLAVSVISPEGCRRDSSITVIIGDSLSPAVSSAKGFAMCAGDSLTLDAGDGYATYAWFEGAAAVGTERYLVTKKASTYVVRVSNAGCSGTSARVTTTVSALPTATATENPAGTLAASTDATSASYQWYDASADPWTAIAGSTQATFTPSSSGRYGVEVTNTATGCRNRSATIDITLGPPPTDPVITALTPSATVCQGETALLRVRVVGGRMPYSYQWADGATTLPFSDTTATLTPSTSTMVTCIVTDADGKQDTAAMMVTVKSRPVATITETSAGTLTAEPSGADNYQWLDASLLPVSGAVSATYQPGSSGIFYVAVTQQGCADTSQAFTYTAPPNGQLEVSDYSFGSVPVDDLINSSGGHAGSVRVQNLTGSYLELTGATTADPAAFVVPQQWPRRLNNGDTAEIAVRFKPTEKRAYSAGFTVTTTTTFTGRATITGTGRDLQPDERVTQVMLRPSRTEVDPGDTISVKLLVNIERPQATAGRAGRYISTIQWDYRALELLPTPGVSYDTTGTFAVASLPSGMRQQNQMQLYTFRFRAKQGEVDTTTILFRGASGFVWQDDRRNYAALVDSVIRVRVCRDGGPQLIGRWILPTIVSITPNPAKDDVEVTYTSAEDGMLELVAADGKLVATVPARHTAGSARLDLSGLSAGIYTVVLRAGGGNTHQTMLVVP